MSLDKFEFRYEDGETGFLAGVVSEQTDYLSNKLTKIINNPYISIEADVYRSENITLEQAIKNRLDKVWFGNQISELEKEYLIKESKIYLEELKVYKNITEAITNELIVDTRSENIEDIEKIAREYEYNLGIHIEGDIKIYKLESFPNKLFSTLYTYIILKSIAIRINEFYIIMFYGINE